jgi:hypothetical protein
VIDPVDTSAPGAGTAETPANGAPGGPGVAPRAGEPAPPGTSAGRTRSFREGQAQRQSITRERLGVWLVVVILVAAVLTLALVHPSSSSNPYQFPPPAPTIAVHLGLPVTSSVACGSGATASTERIPWTGSTQPLSSGNIVVRLYEIADGDVIGDPTAVANATPSSSCAGAPPDGPASWYVVLAAPGGTNLLTYTVDAGWSSVMHGPTNVTVENGSSLTLVTNESWAGTGRALGVYGFVNDTSVSGSVPL